MVLSDIETKRTKDALVRAGGNQTKAAKDLGIARTTLQSRVYAKSTLYRMEGENGEAILQWVKEKQDQERAFADAIRDVFAKYRGKAKLPAPARGTESDLLTVYPVADLHLGMYSWAEETGADFDVYIAERLLVDTAKELIARAPASETAILLNLGDWFHADNSSNQTERSKNILDVDTRYSKVVRLGVKLQIILAQLALQKHKNLIIRNLPGNHDKHTAQTLTIALEAYFADREPRVVVDSNPGPFFFYRHGRVFIGATHGDKAKIEDMPGIMAAKEPGAWGQTLFRYAYGGHWHKNMKGGGEKAGATWEIFRTIAPKDAWNNEMGFTSGRGMVAITHDKNRGEIVRQTLNIMGSE